jgi:dihydrofolate synthase/folylpolyglutamate synthase
MKIEPEYQQTLDYLYSYIDFSLVRNLRYSPEKFDLEPMYEFIQALGEPQREYPVIHVAGTKGKGSVSAMCADALQAAGYKVGLYTSPHLSDFNERIQINRTPITHMSLVDLVEQNKPLIESIPKLTTFEIGTALAFQYFSLQEVNAAVVEVGLGGRLDPTNVVSPIVSVITSISYDHIKILGNTLAEIAGEKGGIIKENVPVVLAPQKDEAHLVIEEIAKERSSPLYQVGVDYLFAPLTRSLEGQSMLVWPESDQDMVDAYIETGGLEEWEPTRLYIPLLGFHQVENAATAYTALQVARKSGLRVNDSAIRDGFENVSWPARFEIIQQEPAIIVDSAHNRDSALKLRLAVDDYFPGKPVILVFGASEDKDIHGMFAELLPRVKQVLATKSEHPRAIDPDQLVELTHQFGKPAQSFDQVEGALEEAIRLAEGKAVVLITGSIFVAAAGRDVYKERLQLLGSAK